MLNHRSTKTFRLNGRLYMKGTGSNSGSIRFKTDKGNLKSFGSKVHNLLKKVGPKIIHGGRKLLNFVASDPTVKQLIASTANQVLKDSGDTVNQMLAHANDVVKNVSEKKVKDTIDSGKSVVKDVKDLVNKWKDNNKKVQTSNVKPETKSQVQENTEKLTEAAEKGRLGTLPSLKNVQYLNLLTKSSRGGTIGTSASVVKEIRDALGLPATPIAQKGRVFLGDLKPKYLLSEISGNTNFGQKKPSKGKLDRSPGKQIETRAPKTYNNTVEGKGDIIKKFEALF